MNYNNFVLLTLSICVFYLIFLKKENMSNTDVKKMISDIYQADIQSIRNLSKLANDLTSNGKLRIPGGLEVDGELNIKGEAKFYKSTWFQNQKKPNIWSHMNWRDGQIYLRGIVNLDGYGGTRKDLNVGGNLNIMGTSTFNGPTNFKNQKTGHSSHLNQPDGNIYLRGNVIMDGNGGSGKDLHVNGVTHLKKDLKIGKNGPLLTHFNVNNKGENFIRGNLRLDGSGGHHNNHSSFGQGMHLIDVYVPDDKNVLIRNASGHPYHKDRWVCFVAGWSESFGGPHGANNEHKFCYIGPHNHWHIKSGRTSWSNCHFTILCIPRTLFNRVDHNAREYRTFKSHSPYA